MQKIAKERKQSAHDPAIDPAPLSKTLLQVTVL